MELVFLQSQEVELIVPQKEDRKLSAVAKRALALENSKRRLSSNWDIDKVLNRIGEENCEDPTFKLPELLIRDSKLGWYLQDGNHRALGYAMRIMSEELKYVPQAVYCATNTDLI